MYVRLLRFLAGPTPAAAHSGLVLEAGLDAGAEPDGLAHDAPDRAGAAVLAHVGAAGGAGDDALRLADQAHPIEAKDGDGAGLVAGVALGTARPQEREQVFEPFDKSPEITRSLEVLGRFQAGAGFGGRRPHELDRPPL